MSASELSDHKPHYRKLQPRRLEECRTGPISEKMGQEGRQPMLELGYQDTEKGQLLSEQSLDSSEERPACRMRSPDLYRTCCSFRINPTPFLSLKIPPASLSTWLSGAPCFYLQASEHIALFTMGSWLSMLAVTFLPVLRDESRLGCLSEMMPLPAVPKHCPLQLYFLTATQDISHPRAPGYHQLSEVGKVPVVSLA